MTDEQHVRLKILLAYIKNAHRFEIAMSGMDTIMCTHLAARLILDGEPPTKDDWEAFEGWNEIDLDEAVDEETAAKN